MVAILTDSVNSQMPVAVLRFRHRDGVVGTVIEPMRSHCKTGRRKAALRPHWPQSCCGNGSLFLLIVPIVHQYLILEQLVLPGTRSRQDIIHKRNIANRTALGCFPATDVIERHQRILSASDSVVPADDVMRRQKLPPIAHGSHMDTRLLRVVGRTVFDQCMRRLDDKTLAVVVGKMSIDGK